ncbi:MAG TPA: hypothetical protein PKI66_05580 [Methanobacteriaceae archaeon]|nr:hypothetical protein [Methanobacteriaceae archaeon]
MNKPFFVLEDVEEGGWKKMLLGSVPVCHAPVPIAVESALGKKFN